MRGEERTAIWRFSEVGQFSQVICETEIQDHFRIHAEMRFLAFRRINPCLSQWYVVQGWGLKVWGRWAGFWFIGANSKKFKIL